MSTALEAHRIEPAKSEQQKPGVRVDLAAQSNNDILRQGHANPGQAMDAYGFPSADSVFSADPIAANSGAERAQLVAQAPTGSDTSTPAAPARDALAPPMTGVLDTTNPTPTPERFQTINFDGIELHRYPNVSDSFVQSAEQRLAAMPEKEREFLQKASVKISLCDQLNDATPNPEGPFEERGGRFLPDRNEMIFAQRQERIDNQNERKGMRVGHMGPAATTVDESTFYHEWGHALNENMRSRSGIPGDGSTVRYSDTKDFSGPYLQDLMKTFQKHHKDFAAMHYYDSDFAGERNRNEAFAEMYTIIRGKGDPKHYSPDRLLPKDFKHAYDAVRRQLDTMFSDPSAAERA